MKNTLISSVILASTLSSNVLADTTVGFGFGSLYSGLGINFGEVRDNSFMYGSIGCMGGSATRPITINGSVLSRDKGYETNCGIGLGYITTSLLAGNNHGLGLSLGYTYDTDDDIGGYEFHVMPGYHYFFNGVMQHGLNLGLSARSTFKKDNPSATGILFNIGYQF